MKDLNKILEYYPKLKGLIDRDKPKIYNDTTNTQYVKNFKLNPNVGLMYDFGGTEDPVKGKNVVIVDYDPNEDTSNVSNKKTYDKDLTIYKFESKNPNVKLPDELEINGNFFIAYSNILKFPKILKVKNLNMSFCDMEMYLFDSKLLIEGDFELIMVKYKEKNIIQQIVSSFNLNPKNPEEIKNKILELIKQSGGYVKGDIKFQ
jgi:hypothetical protein